MTGYMNVAKRVTCLKDTVVRFPVGPEEKQMPQRPVTQSSHRTKTNVDNKEKQRRRRSRKLRHQRQRRKVSGT